MESAIPSDSLVSITLLARWFLKVLMSKWRPNALLAKTILCGIDVVSAHQPSILSGSSVGQAGFNNRLPY